MLRTGKCSRVTTTKSTSPEPITEPFLTLGREEYSYTPKLRKPVVTELVPLTAHQSRDSLAPESSVRRQKTGLRSPSKRRSEYCIASSGLVLASGPMLVAGVDEVSGSVLNPDKPGHMVSNGSISLTGPSTRVTGDVKAVGSVTNSGAVVEGQVEEHHAEVALPSIPITAYDPGTDVTIVRQLDASYPGLTVSGLARRQGDLMLTVSGLSLDSGLLYVDGNVVINGGVTGLGAIICTGNVTVNGGASLTTANLAAVVAKGHVILRGTPGAGACFRGLVYTEGGLEAAHLKLVGAFVQGGAGGSAALTDCDVVYDPAAVHLEWDIPEFGPGGGNRKGEAQIANGLAAEDFFDKTTGHFDLSRVDDQRVPFRFQTATYASLDEAVGAQDGKPPYLDAAAGTRYPSWEAFFQAGHDRVRAQLSYMDQLNQENISRVRQGKISFDLNQFLNTTDRMRVVFWRDL